MHKRQNLFISLATGLSLTLAALGAQTQNIAYADGDSSPATGGGNAFPWGSVGIRYQSIIPHSTFGSGRLNIVTIRDILLAGHSTDLEVIYDDIEIKMGLTTLATPTTAWATNNPNPTTVYRGPLRVRFTGATPAWGGIGLPNPYLYNPTTASDNLCVEVIVWKADSHSGNFYFPKSSGSINRAFRYQWTSNQTSTPLTGTGGSRMGFVLNDGNIALAGVGCNSSSNTPLVLATTPSWPQLGNKLQVSLSGAAAGAPGFLFIGPKFVGFDLAAAGAPGCYLWNDSTFLLPIATGRAGTASITATVPKNMAPGTIYTHWLIIDRRANAAALTTSDYATIIVGN